MQEQNVEQIKAQIKKQEKARILQGKQNSAIEKQLKKFEVIEKQYNKEKQKLLDLVEKSKGNFNNDSDKDTKNGWNHISIKKYSKQIR